MKSNYQRAKIAIILIWLSLAMDVISSFSSYMQIALLQGIYNGEDYTLEALEANDNREMIIGILYLAVYFSAAVAFLLWFSRAYNNLHTKVKGLAFSKSAAVWTWFIPIVNLFRPYTIMKEMYKRTDDYIKENGLATNNLDLSTQKVSVWWILWIIGALTGQVLSQLTRRADDIDSLIRVSWFEIGMSLIIIPSGIYAIKVIKKYAEAEKVLFKTNSEK